MDEIAENPGTVSGAEFLPLDPRARLLFHAQGLVRFAFVWIPGATMGAVALGIWVTSITIAVGIALAVLFLAFLVALWWPSLTFDRFGYAVADDAVRIRSGVLWRRLVSIPRCRVQHVDVRQGPIEQVFGLSSVGVYTASGVGADGVIPGLDHAEAERLRTLLIVGAEGDDGV